MTTFALGLGLFCLIFIIMFFMVFYFLGYWPIDRVKKRFFRLKNSMRRFLAKPENYNLEDDYRSAA